ncbi:hypothetical protein Ppa06_68020 [Planomonospora parontospora subsp. parontospora]|uniref:DUF4352 domain-containing protein n=2 Tax=Planomonospora parontospora TaxID=58119 RepID=A0AA37F895_9ACTN|nr:hypothetical protein GCM10010126_69040 [Planomonospora parontospora]GII13004.1 hypothetical protein Ppa06_68020 [Planomonospora parontospora subsp. parontospora]
MRSTIRALCVAVLLLAACACGNEDDFGVSTEEFAPNTGANEIINDMYVRNAFIIGSPEGESLPPGSSLPLYVTLVNQRTEPDRLVSVSASPTFKGFQVRGGGLELPVRQPVGGDVNPQALLTGSTGDLRSGIYLPVSFQFQDAGTVQMQVPVLPPSQWRATYSPWPSPTS